MKCNNCGFTLYSLTGTPFGLLLTCLCTTGYARCSYSEICRQEDLVICDSNCFDQECSQCNGMNEYARCFDCMKTGNAIDNASADNYVSR